MAPTKQPPPEKDHSDDNEREVGKGQAQEEEREMQHENADGKELPAESNEEMLVDTQPRDKLQSSLVLAIPAATTRLRTRITLSPDAPTFYPAKFSGPGFAPQQILPGAYHSNVIRWNEGLEKIPAFVEYVPTTTIGEESCDRAEDSAEDGGDHVPESAHTGDEQQSPNTRRQSGRPVLRG